MDYSLKVNFYYKGIAFTPPAITVPLKEKDQLCQFGKKQKDALKGVLTR
jgi:hypothetical protein